MISILRLNALDAELQAGRTRISVPRMQNEGKSVFFFFLSLSLTESGLFPPDSPPPPPPPTASATLYLESSRGGWGVWHWQPCFQRVRSDSGGAEHHGCSVAEGPARARSLWFTVPVSRQAPVLWGAAHQCFPPPIHQPDEPGPSC